MPRPPHPLALFSLLPCSDSELAKSVVACPDNARHLSRGPGGDALDVGFHIRGKSSTTLAVLGRGPEADIYVRGASIGKVQCSFEVDLQTGVVMLYDRSLGQTTQVSGPVAMPFEHGRARRVVVRDGLNIIIGMGGVRRDLCRFQLIWHRNDTEMDQIFNRFADIADHQMDNSRLCRTEDEAPTELATTMQTRVHTAVPQPLKMRYIIVEEVGKLGAGRFGSVHKAIDVDSGTLMAVKILQQPAVAAQDEWNRSLYCARKREVEIMSQLKHRYVIDYIASEGWDGPEVQIFMGLKEGSLKSLMIGTGADVPTVANLILEQMLEALDFIAFNGIIHRDVKPENILYTTDRKGQYRFQLGDFGLCTRHSVAVSHVGTGYYMAPEMFQGVEQTPKVDVWSLFVTLMWVANAANFREALSSFSNATMVQQTVQSVASAVEPFPRIREMAMLDPRERASAAQMLVKHFDGKGLSTPRCHVPPLAADPLALASSIPTARATRITRATSARRPDLVGRLFGAAPPYRAGRLGGPVRPAPYRWLPRR
ncbi:hypothetical protein E4U43_002415 [Claviceps pusilla]|uniref:Protein kinase domain-containing protein n=1 Tax=Claviceps pusilla TaxID=123648 RepID=A0A9P7N8R8_9HYPO|nr:hypothetical protein E4U43_002415 [Claviceps pusilla]